MIRGRLLGRISRTLMFCPTLCCFRSPSLTPSHSQCFPSCCLSSPADVSSLCFLPVCVCVALAKDYVTVGQLHQMYGLPKVESSPTSPLRQPLQSGAVDPAFSCLHSPHGSSLSLSAEVCSVSLPSIFPPFLPFSPLLATFIYRLFIVINVKSFQNNLFAHFVTSSL